MTSAKDMILPLPFEFMDGDECSIFDALWQDFEATMINLAHLVLADSERFAENMEYCYRASEKSPVYSIRVNRYEKTGCVGFRMTSHFTGPKGFLISVDVDKTEPREHVEIIGAPVTGLSAIAKAFLKCYRKAY